MFWDEFQEWLAQSRFVRQAAEVLLRASARRRLVEYDLRDAARSQARILRGLVHRAHATRFGREHDFRRIRTPEDFRRLVPLRSASELRRDHELPIEPSVLADSHRQAALTALAFADRVRPRGRSANVVVRMADGCPANCLPRFLGRLVHLEAEGQNDTGMSLDGAISLRAIWPTEGPIALEDPRHGSLRLLTDHGVFFEFVPVEEIGGSRPTRHTIGEVETSISYTVALTSPAGVWACLTEIAVRFERRNIPLLRLVKPDEMECFRLTIPEGTSHSVIPPPRHPATTQEPHPRKAGTPAARPGTIVHSL